MQDQPKDKDAKPASNAPQTSASQPGPWTKPVQTIGASGVAHSTPALLPAPLASANGLARYTGMFAAGVVVGVLVTWGFAANNDRRTVAGPNATSTPTTNQAAGVVLGPDGTANASFEVASPQAAGKKIQIARAIVTKPTWVVVYESVNGAPGRALGASLFTTKKSTGAVTLLRSTVAGKTYFVGQATDNGNGTFSLTTDKPVLTGTSRLLLTVTVQ